MRFTAQRGSTYTAHDHSANVLWTVRPTVGEFWTIDRLNLLGGYSERPNRPLPSEYLPRVLEAWGAGDLTWIEQIATVTPLGHVYVIGNPSLYRPIKIGYTRGPVKSRLAAIATMSPVPIVELWSCEGTFRLEAELHDAFCQHRIHGEWFDFGHLDPVATIRQYLGVAS